MRFVVLVVAGLACAGGDDGDDGVPDSPQPFNVVLGAPEGCAAYDKVKPANASEIDGWAVAKLTPPYTPAQVNTVVARFDGRMPCTITIGGTLRVAAGGDAPPESPEFLYFGEVQASAEGPGTIFMMEMPSTYLGPGESLYVYHRLSGVEGATRCMSLCQDEDRSSEGWVSPQGEAPHSYESLADRGYYGAVAVEMSGTAPVTLPN